MAYQNFMGNKDFHPSSFRNLKKMYEAEQRQKQEEKRQEDLRLQYIKEQEIYNSKELMGKANPLNFMYEPPPGLAKDGKVAGSGQSKKEGGDEPKLKFDWQKSGRTAPREEFAKDMELRDKPFGIEVRNVKCIKCGKWGHINTDRVCPLYGKAKPVSEDDGATAAAGPLPAPLPDIDTIEDGLIFKQCVRDRVVDDLADNQQIILSDDETHIGELLSGLSKKERKRVLRKLAKSEGGVDGGEGERKEKRKHSGKKTKKSKKQCRKRDYSESSSTESKSEDEERERKQKKHHKTKKQHSKKASGQKVGSSDDSQTESESEDNRERRKKQKKTQSKEVNTSDSETDQGRKQKRQRRDDGERYHVRQSSGHYRERSRERLRDNRDTAKSHGGHYERGRTRDGEKSGDYERSRTRYDRDRETSRHSTKHDYGRSSLEEDSHSHSRNKKKHL